MVAAAKRWRGSRFYSPGEVAGFVALAAVVLVGMLLAMAGAWALLAVTSFILAVLIGVLALLAVRRSHLVARHFSAQLDARARRWKRDTAKQADIVDKHRKKENSKQQVIIKRDSRPDAAARTQPLTDNGVLSTYVQFANRMPDSHWLDSTILRNASTSGRDLLAYAASDGGATYADIVRELVLVRMPDRHQQGINAIKALDVSWGLRLARVVALQNHFANDRIDALTLYRSLYDLHGPKAIRPPSRHARVFQQLAYELGEFELADELTRRLRCSEADLPAMRADLLNPFSASPYADADAWLKQFNHYFESEGLEPVRLERGSGEPFDWLRCDATSFRDDGPLVTIVVSAWQPGQGLITAVRSLLAQSHRNIEILVVDDCSPDEYLPVLEQVAALDQRVRVLRQPVNGGTYLARNRALDEAQGEFMTFLDSDDWSHPRRIEMQVDALVEDDALIYTTTRSLRTDLRFVFNLPGIFVQRENASSLMFRLQPIYQHVGYFNNVRKGADTEYALRLRRIFGPQCYRTLQHNLGMIRLTVGSLSRSEFKPGWRHPSRSSYRRGHEKWHNVPCLNTESLRTAKHSDTTPFPVPLRFLVDRASAESTRRSTLDILLVADLRQGDENLRTVLDEAFALRREGLRVGVMHIESFRLQSQVEVEPFWGPLCAAINNRELDEVLVTDAVQVDTVVIRDPEVLQFVDTRPSALDVGQVIVVAPYPSRDREKRRWFEPSACHRNAQALFDTTVAWITATSDSRKDLKPLLPCKAILNVGWPMVVASTPEQTLQRSRTADAIVVGRIVDARSTGLATSPSVMRAVYPVGTDIQVRMIGNRSHVDKRLGGQALPGNWQFHDAAELSRGAFLRACEFYVYFTRPGVTPAATRDVLEAMAAGCIVVTSSNYADIYGQAAVCCEPHEVIAAMRRLHEDQDAAAAQREAGRAYVAAHAGGAALADVLKQLMNRDCGPSVDAGRHQPSDGGAYAASAADRSAETLRVEHERKASPQVEA